MRYSLEGICSFNDFSSALKTDMTKYGRVTVRGKVRDAVNGMKRYLSSNFQDTNRQHGIDMMLGVDGEGAGDGTENGELLLPSEGNSRKAKALHTDVDRAYTETIESCNRRGQGKGENIDEDRTGEEAEDPSSRIYSTDTAVFSNKMQGALEVRKALHEIEHLLQARNARIAAAWKVKVEEWESVCNSRKNINKNGGASAGDETRHIGRESRLSTRNGERKTAATVVPLQVIAVHTFDSLRKVLPKTMASTRAILFLTSFSITFLSSFRK